VGSDRDRQQHVRHDQWDRGRSGSLTVSTLRIWPDIPAVIKVQYCVGVRITGNVLQTRSARKCTALVAEVPRATRVHDNSTTAGDTWVSRRGASHRPLQPGCRLVRGGRHVLGWSVCRCVDAWEAPVLRWRHLQRRRRGRTYGTGTSVVAARSPVSAKGRNSHRIVQRWRTFSGRGPVRTSVPAASRAAARSAVSSGIHVRDGQFEVRRVPRRRIRPVVRHGHLRGGGTSAARGSVRTSPRSFEAAASPRQGATRAEVRYQDGDGRAVT